MQKHRRSNSPVNQAPESKKITKSNPGVMPQASKSRNPVSKPPEPDELTVRLRMGAKRALKANFPKRKEWFLRRLVDEALSLRGEEKPFLPAKDNYQTTDEPIHGVQPFQIVRIDHSLADLEIVDLETDNSLGPVWLSFAVDAESGRWVGLYVSFRPPSYKSCMMVLRDITGRFDRSPDMIVVDDGKEFHSSSFVHFCRIFGIKLRYRRQARCRFAADTERLEVPNA